MYTKEEARKNIKKLAESFGEKLAFIKTSGKYKEAHIEDEFIKPLFKYLNWNISNEGIASHSDREFIVQAQGRKGKEPDYLLQLDNRPRFYIEAKHSKYYLGGKTEDKGKVKERTDYIWQAYTYSYSTQTRPSYEKVDFALLTDFEEFRFFDCTFAVKNPELINNYCVIDWTYNDYIENFDKLWDSFERENVRNGSLEKLYINEKKIKENRISPDKAFLIDLDDENNGWRIKLAKDIKKYHPDFSAEFITQAVQLILDRFIFMKVLADREIEEDYIQSIVNKIQNSNDKEEGIVYEECRELFEELDKTYNGSIFIKREELDKAHVSNKTILEVLKNFLPENSRYNFKVIPVEILGTIYEQFLGKVVVTSDKRAKIDYKPEVRKAGGVYYTPDYIVNYIVEKTVGEKLKECKKFEDLLEIKICDPACGSGSFLIVAYDYLIKWTIKYFEKKIKNGSNGSELKGLSKEEKKLVYLDENNTVRLTSKIKRDILQSCIYGVDIDSQAVEVTKMSLSLKTLENTTHYEVHSERTLFHTTILPPLEGNIKCGNSLVATDIYDSELAFSRKEYDKLNPFDWRKEFWNQFKGKKFDCVIGNPPYITFSLGRGRTKTESIDLTYISEKWKNSSDYKINSFALFYELSHQIMGDNSYVAYIVPGTILINDSLKKIRKYLLDNNLLYSFHKLDYKVFEQAEMGDCAILILRNRKNITANAYYSNSSEGLLKSKATTIDYKAILMLDDFRLLNNSIDYKLLKPNPNLLPLEEVCKFYNGIKTGDNKKYISDKRINAKYKPVIRGKDFIRYGVLNQKVFVLFDPKKLWSNCDESKLAVKKKIFIRQTADSIIATYDNKSFYPMDTVHIIYESKIDLKILLGILNSEIFNKLYQSMVPEMGKVFAEVKIANLKKIKIPNIQLINSKKEKIEAIVDEILSSNKNLLSNNQENINTLQRKIAHLEDKLNDIVYQLYNFTPEEIKILEKENE